MTTLVVISPHLDDAVLSCGGAIHAHTRGGRRAVVVTVFSDGRDGALRRDEDRAALAELGAEAVHLGLLDAPERLGLARSHRALVTDAEIRADDVRAVRAAVDRVLAETAPARVLAPLGVGGHIDHRVVRVALGEGDDVTWYEERPYALLVGATRAAFTHPPRELGGAPAAAEIARDLDRLAFVRAYLAGAEERSWLVSELGRAREISPAYTGVITRHDEDTAGAVGRAIARYRSQVHALFGGVDRIALTLVSAARALGVDDAPHAERTFVRGATEGP